MTLSELPERRLTHTAVQSADSKPLASLVLPSQQPARLSSGPSSAPARSSSPLPFSSSPFGSRPSTPSEDRRRTANPPPALDKARAAAVCALAEDELLLLGLHELEQLKAEIEAISRYASGALTHALLVREKEVGDGETYHGMIQVSSAPFPFGVSLTRWNADAGWMTRTLSRQRRSSRRARRRDLARRARSAEEGRRACGAASRAGRVRSDEAYRR
mgnify:CR=1 FL=1